MTSITKILILISAIIAINGQAIKPWWRNDTDQSNGQISSPPLDWENVLKYVLPQTGIIKGLPKADVGLGQPIRGWQPKSKDLLNDNVSKPGSRREQRQALFKTKGSDDGPNSVLSLFTRSSSPIRSMISNRIRRSSSIPAKSSNKNTTVEVRPTVVNRQPPKNNKRLIDVFLNIISSPYVSIF